MALRPEFIRKAFEVTWRLAVLSLPWQTRLFWDAELVGWPWEQGRFSIYASWIPLVVTILLGLSSKEQEVPEGIRKNVFWIFAALAGCTLIAAPSQPNAAIQWWLQIFLLSAFFITLFRNKVSFDKVSLWFVLSLVPHAILAISQAVTQVVWGSKWLGISAQNPLTLGVSVVPAVDGRFLRAYGGFPHPNILGGWMAVGLVTVIFQKGYWFKDKIGTWFEWLGMSGLELIFSAALFYSFSRSAWLAVSLGVVSAIVVNLIKDSSEARKIAKKSFVPVVVFLILASINLDLLSTRFQPSASRIEQKSVSTRWQSLKDGVDVYRANILFGAGPNSELPALAQIRGITQSPAPLEPPHMVWLLMLVNFGTVGALFVFGLGLFALRKILERWRFLGHGLGVFVSLSAILLIVGSLDHYLWSGWAGQTMLFWCLGNLTSTMSKN